MKDMFVTGRGVYLPKLSHSNETLPPLRKPVTDAQLERLGVRRRGWAGKHEGIAEMASHAARQALERADVGIDTIDLIILANWTQRRYIPEFAPKVQKLLGAQQAFAFDVSGACTGFVNGLGIAHHFLQNPRYRRALVVASETTSQRATPRSRATLVFGDAAAAWVLDTDAAACGDAMRIVDYEMVSDGDHHHIMDINEDGYVVTHMKQKELNVLAAQSFAKASRSVLLRQRLTMADVDWIVPHSGTAGIQATLVRALEVPPEKVLSNYADVGNVSSAAIPVSLEAFIEAGTIKKGDRILSPTTGTGWYYAAVLYVV